MCEGTPSTQGGSVSLGALTGRVVVAGGRAGQMASQADDRRGCRLCNTDAQAKDGQKSYFKNKERSQT